MKRAPSPDRVPAQQVTKEFEDEVVKEDVLPNDQLFNALSLREELAELPPPDPDKDDPWIRRSDPDAPKPA